jgi:glycosyltransferase involved in cell wall biosynthesis
MYGIRKDTVTLMNSPTPSHRGPQAILISVVIPAYNSANYIGETIESVRGQTFGDYEIILVNDGSPDTPQLERAIAPYLDHIRYIKQENRGPSAARNVGILEARGKYVAFLDSDDLWLPCHLEAQLRLLEKDPSLSLVYADGILTIEGAPVRRCFQNSPQAGPVTFESLVGENCSVVTSAVVAARQALLHAGLFDERFHRCEDFDFWARIAHCGFRIDYSREIQIVHCVAPDGLSSDAESMKRSLVAVYQKLMRLPLTHTQKQLLSGKEASAQADLQLALCKKFVLAGQLAQALESARAAKNIFDTRKVRALIFALRVLPRPFSTIYPLYVKALGRRNRARLKRLNKRVDPEARKAHTDFTMARRKIQASNKPNQSIEVCCKDR